MHDLLYQYKYNIDVEKLNSQKYFYLLRELDILEFAMLKKLSPTIRTPQCIKNIHQSCVKNFDGLTIEDIHMRLESLISKGITEKISSKEFMNMISSYEVGKNVEPGKPEKLAEAIIEYYDNLDITCHYCFCHYCNSCVGRRFRLWSK